MEFSYAQIKVRNKRLADESKKIRLELLEDLPDEYARVAETTHETMSTHKAEVRNAKGECILDDFLE